jgi:hypothetical protein
MNIQTGKKYHYIYKTTCIVTGKYYLGMHSTYNLNDGYIGSGKRLGYSINKHGKENHVCEIIEHYFTREWLREREAELVCAETLTDPTCMNLALGGGVSWPNHIINSDSDRQKAKNKLSQERQVWLKENDPGWAIRTKANRAASAKANRSTAKSEACTFKGKNHTEEAKKKIGEKVSKSARGTGNSQYGTMWIFSEVEKRTIKINREDIDLWLSRNWKLGRKMKFP